MPRPGDFSAQADAYARARPTYPVEIVDRLWARAGLDGAEAGARIAELGAGTGLFTAHLAGRGLPVIAVEPGARMRALAPELPGVSWRAGSFESPGLEPASAVWIVAAQAFHWADPTRALPAMREALRPGGQFTVLWNNRDLDSPLLAHTRALIHAMVPGFDEGYRHRDWARVLTSTGDFEAVESDEVRHVVTMSHARFLDLWRSHNKLDIAAAAVGPTLMPAFLTAVEEHLRTQHPDPVPVHYRCLAWTARRRG